MLQEFKEIKSTPRDIRNFSYILSGALGLWLALTFWQKGIFLTPIYYTAIAVIFLGVAIPKILKPIYLAWMGLGVMLGWLMTRLILLIVFYCILTPLGVLKKFFEKQSAFQKPNPQALSYWIKRDSKTDETKTQLEQQF